MAPHTRAWPSQQGLAYAGIGSRETPPTVLDLMGRFASQLSIQGWVLRTGMAGGADQAFYRGAHAPGRLSSTCRGQPSRPTPAHPPAPHSSTCSGSRARPPTSWRRSFTRLGRGWPEVFVLCTRATAIRCSAPTWPARRASCCAGRLTAASTAAADVSAGPARRCASPTTTASRSSTSPGPSTSSGCHGTASPPRADAARRRYRGVTHSPLRKHGRSGAGSPIIAPLRGAEGCHRHPHWSGSPTTERTLAMNESYNATLTLWPATPLPASVAHELHELGVNLSTFTVNDGGSPHRAPARTRSFSTSHSGAVAAGSPISKRSSPRCGSPASPTSPGTSSRARSPARVAPLTPPRASSASSR